MLKLSSASCAQPHRRWGHGVELDRRGYPSVSRSTVYWVLVGYQLIEPSRAASAATRTSAGNTRRRWAWQLDVTASLFLAGGRECAGRGDDTEETGSCQPAFRAA